MVLVGSKEYGVLVVERPAEVPSAMAELEEPTVATGFVPVTGYQLPSPSANNFPAGFGQKGPMGSRD